MNRPALIGMFGYPGWVPTMKKHYVVIATFSSMDWYLADVKKSETSLKAIVREWTSDADGALTFDRKEDAETIALMVCGDADYKIGGISKIK